MEGDEVPLAVAIEDVAGTGTIQEGKEIERTTVPVTIVTGFLGSGKTTLVRHILHSDHGYRIAVILNEFGEDVGIESAFVQAQEGLQGHDGEWVELTNGCMCCSVKSDFLQALESLLDRPGERRFDYILIETTGLANPGPIATALWTDAELETRVSLDGVVTVVDAVNINRQLHEPRPRGSVNEAQLQVAYADLVILNKLDLAEEEALMRAEADIRAINSGVTIVRTQHSKVDLGHILNRDAYSHKGEITLPPIAEAEDEEDDTGFHTPERTSDAPSLRRRSAGVSCCSSRAHSFHGKSGGGAVAAALAAAASAAAAASGDAPPAGEGDLSPAGSGLVTALGQGGGAQAQGVAPPSPHPHVLDDDHVHDNSISTVSMRSDVPVDLDRFKCWVDHLLWDRDSRPDEIYRMKGLLSVAGSDKKHMLQAVYELYDILSGPHWDPEEARKTRVVIIGRNLRPDAVKASWDKYVGSTTVA